MAKDGDRKVAKGLAWLVRKMGIPDAVREFKEASQPDPAVQKQQDAAAVEESMRRLAIRIVAYRARHGHFPRELADLMHQGLDQAKELVVAEEGEAGKPAKGKKLPAFDKSDYVYFPLGEDCDGDMVLMYEPPEHHGNKGTNVTLANGHVLWMDAETFDRERRRSEDYIASRQQGQEQG